MLVKYKMGSWHLLFLFGLWRSLVYGTECPFHCQCYQQSGMNSIFCINVNRQYIPNYFDFDVKIFNFSRNSLPDLSRFAFQNQHYKSLEILDLRRNNIAKIHDKAFHLLKNLLEIDLSNNLIHFINRKMFNNNKFLNTIILSGNPITEIKDYIFPPSIYLHHLDFQGCKIEKIHKYAFVNVPLVEYLNLKDNNLKSLSLQVLHYTAQLKFLLLDGNPWRCNRKLWLVLKWSHDRNIGKESQLCVYGETESTVLWDTMELNHPAKFLNYNSDPGVKKIKWAQGLKRPRRSLEEAKLKKYEKSGYMDFDYAKSANPSETIITDKQMAKLHDPDFHSQFDISNQQTHRDKESSTKVPQRHTLIDSFERNKHISVHYTDKENLPDENSSNNFPQRNQWGKQEKENYTTKAHLFPKFIPSNATKTYSDVIHTFPKFENNGNVKEIKSQYETGELNNRTNFVTDIETPSSLEDNESSKDPVNMNIMLILIITEFSLLMVLLYILYKLWKWNQGGIENDVNTPLNNSSKNSKNYNTNSPGYMRYSLSDDDPSLRNNNILEEGKYDNESGYLSYHRYNSIDGENNSDFMFYRHCPRNDNNDSIKNDGTKNFPFEHKLLENTDRRPRNIRRNSSIHSMGRNTKTNTFTRSVSADTADQYYPISFDNIESHFHSHGNAAQTNEDVSIAENINHNTNQSCVKGTDL